MQTLRLADPATAARYPLPVTGPLEWADHDGAVLATFALPPLPAGSIVVPSLALPDTPMRRQRWTLSDGPTRWTLPDVPAAAPVPTAAQTDPRVTLHIDCFHVHQRLAEPRLGVVVAGAAAPTRYLCTASARPLTLESIAVPDHEAGGAVPPAAISQMRADGAIAARICSPTSVAMVLARQVGTEQWMTIVEECRDAATGMFGVWPLAIAAAARRGVLGAVETFTDWQAPLAVLAQGFPLVASIRFARGALPGAPQEQSGGHLLVVYRADPTTIWVNDPAAPEPVSVPRAYPAEAFTRAWLGYRGAAYILPS